MKVLQDRHGHQWTLARGIGEGGEADVYAVRERADLLAKIYRPAPPADYECKLAWMLANPPEHPTDAHGHAAIAWPTGLLYDPLTGLVGFLMGRIRDGRPLFELANPKLRAQVAPSFDRRYLHRTASNLASGIDGLHLSGYVVGDLNESNVLVTSRALTTVIDADSFQVQEERDGTIVLHRCRVGKLDYTPPELQGQALGNVVRTPAHDRFALAVVVFQLLMEGAHPFTAQWLGRGEPPSREERIRLGYFPYADPAPGLIAPPAYGVPFDTLAPVVSALMTRCFVAGHADPDQRPTAAEWEQALETAEQALVRCDHGHLYADHLRVCPWCAGRIQVVRPRPRLQPVRRPLPQSEYAPGPMTATRHVVSPSPAASLPQQSLPPLSVRPQRSTGPQWGQIVWAVIFGFLLLSRLVGFGNNGPASSRPRTASVRLATRTPSPTPRPTVTPAIRMTPTPRLLPSITTKPYPIVAATVSGNASLQANAWDGDTGTAWHDDVAGRKTVAYLEVDLGASRPIGAVRWWLTTERAAGAMRVRIYDANRRVEAEYVARAEGPNVNQWDEFLPDARGRYIRFEFPNPRADGIAGGLAEVAILPPQSVTVATSIAASRSSPGRDPPDGAPAAALNIAAAT